jgi:PilZ domain
MDRYPDCMGAASHNRKACFKRLYQRGAAVLVRAVTGREDERRSKYIACYSVLGWYIPYIMHMADTLGIPDRRKASRFQMALPVELPQGMGITRDLSARGVFFQTDCLLAPGELIQFALVLEYVDPGGPVRLQCRGRVVRLERQGGTLGVAVAITAYRLDARSQGGRGVRSPTVQ